MSLTGIRRGILAPVKQRSYSKQVVTFDRRDEICSVKAMNHFLKERKNTLIARLASLTDLT